MLKIELCSLGELPKLLEFINNSWKENHALSSSKSLMDWQHLNIDDSCYNFLIAKDSDTEKILGILGFINTAQFDKELLENGDYYGAIWKIDNTNPLAIGLGHSLFKKLLKLPHFKNFGAIGISNDTINYMKVIHYKVEKLTQYYILNDSISDFKIAIKNNPVKFLNARRSSDFKLKRIEKLDDIVIQSIYKPAKTTTFLINKYQRHPIYQYNFYGIINKEKTVAVLVVRKITLNNCSCLRIVDCVGNLSTIDSLYHDFQQLLVSENAEFIDFYNYGIEASVFQAMGFKARMEDDSNVIPNYFEPFEQKNVTIHCAFNSNDPNYVFFKGDSDQDRPNLINN